MPFLSVTPNRLQNFGVSVLAVCVRLRQGNMPDYRPFLMIGYFMEITSEKFNCKLEMLFL